VVLLREIDENAVSLVECIAQYEKRVQEEAMDNSKI
jgi:hypothetical protein